MNDDFLDLIEELLTVDARFLVVRGYAVGAPGKVCKSGACVYPVGWETKLPCGHPGASPCPPGTVCLHGACTQAFDLGCSGDCTGKQCGDDGCGASCGLCKPGEACVAGQCVCTPKCAGKSCGSDGCGGSCGSCVSPQTCVDGQCACPLGACGGPCSCASPQVCTKGQCTCPEGSCGGPCPACPPGQVCKGNKCEVKPCVPDCAGKSCGGDGCGGCCGGTTVASNCACPCGQVCSSGACSKATPNLDDSAKPATTLDCQGTCPDGSPGTPYCWVTDAADPAKAIFPAAGFILNNGVVDANAFLVHKAACAGSLPSDVGGVTLSDPQLVGCRLYCKESPAQWNQKWPCP